MWLYRFHEFKMQIKLIYFAVYAELLGKRQETIVLEKEISVGALFERLCQGLPNQEALLQHTVFAVNEEYVESSHILKDQDEVVFIPPVSGG